MLGERVFYCNGVETPCPAVVAAVDGNLVNLSVLLKNGTYVSRQNVPLKDKGEYGGVRGWCALPEHYESCTVPPVPPTPPEPEPEPEPEPTSNEDEPAVTEDKSPIDEIEA